MKRENYFSGAPWEQKVGYSRAVKVGNTIEVTGTVATENGNIVGPGSPYLQTKFIIEKIEKVLFELGANLTHVVRTRIYVTDISKWEEIGKAHFEFFGNIFPATSMVEVSNLIESKYLVEIEATAIITD